MLKRNLKLRILIPLVVFTFFMLTSVVAVYIHIMDEIEMAENDTEKHVRLKMYQLQSALNRLIPLGLDFIISSQISDIYIDPSITSFAIINPNDSVIFTNYSEFKGRISSQYPNYSISVAQDVLTTKTPVVIRKNEHLFGYYPVHFELKSGTMRTNEHGVMFFEYDFSRIIQRTIKHALLKSTVFIVAGVLLSIALAFAFMRVIMARIDEINKGMLLVSQGRHETIQDSGNDEISSLVHGFNHMADQIAQKSESLEQTQFMIDHSSESVYLILPDGAIYYVNTAACEMLGYSLTELRALHITDIISDFTLEDWAQHWADLSSQNSIMIESMHVAKDGTLIPVEVSANYFKFGTSELNCAFVRDITERKKAEAEILQQNHEYLSLSEEYKAQNEQLKISVEKAKESDALKTSFLQNMSHEIRTPLNGIIGFSDILSTAKTLEHCNEFGQIIKQSGRRLLNLVNDILDISKIESGQIVVDETVFDIVVELNELIMLHEKYAKDQNLSLVYEKNAYNSIYVCSDRNRISQVVTNLLSNACKFTKNGTVYLTLTIVENSQISICVKDTGIGISEDIQERVFERFYQADSSSSRSHEGTGLGLSISKAIAQLLGGDITLSSEIGKGSSFTFTIPYEPELNFSATTKSQTVIEAEAFIGANILIVEDDYFNYLYLAEILSHANIIHAKNGKEAVDIIRNHHTFNAILMDLKMPIMDGYEATQIIKELSPKTPIIAQTAFVMKDDILRAIKAGCSDFVPKPVDKQELYLKLASHMIQI